MDWHARYLQQARWTRDLRAYLFEKADTARAAAILEVGCGTGVILGEIVTRAALHGLDLDPNVLTHCQFYLPTVSLVRADALVLPYPDGIFDLVYCHYLLLWVDDPLQALREMKRVTQPGGHILALAEPDYYARIDRPHGLVELGRWQTESLKRQGAHPGFGAHLAEAFRRAGISIVETGTMKNMEKTTLAEERELEWAVYESDLTGFVSDRQIQKMKLLDEQAWRNGRRVLYVPTYFAWGKNK